MARRQGRPPEPPAAPPAAPAPAGPSGQAPEDRSSEPADADTLESFEVVDGGAGDLDAPGRFSGPARADVAQFHADAVWTPRATTPDQLAELVERLPDVPGVYIMRDRRGEIVYVGKARRLRARVRQYFNGGEGKVRTIGEQVALESRTRVLNPKWYEEMLRHGAEGVRHIEAHVTNTMGWSATTGQVDPWVYKQISLTFVIDPEMRERMAKLNPKASVKLANRLLEANQRKYWEPEPSMLDALRRAGEELEDRLEGVGAAAAAA